MHVASTLSLWPLGTARSLLPSPPVPRAQLTEGGGFRQTLSGDVARTGKCDDRAGIPAQGRIKRRKSGHLLRDVSPPAPSFLVPRLLARSPSPAPNSVTFLCPRAPSCAVSSCPLLYCGTERQHPHSCAVCSNECPTHSLLYMTRDHGHMQFYWKEKISLFLYPERYHPSRATGSVTAGVDGPLPQKCLPDSRLRAGSEAGLGI